MDRTDPEVMAAERHQDRLDADADARDVGRWHWRVIRDDTVDGLVLQEGWEDSPEDAYDNLEAAAPGEDDVDDWEDPAAYERFWTALQGDVPDGGELRVVDPMGTVYAITDTL